MKLIFSVKEIFSEYLKDNEKFVVPEYQRGYKWKTKDIIQLLDDINRFQAYGDDDVFYCLQNITLIKGNGNYNVVDGQQRLTTLTILLAYLGEIGLVTGKLEYKIRNISQKFLSEYIFLQKVNNFKNNSLRVDGLLLEWDNLGVDINDEFNYQDIFYMYNAYKAIHEWFLEHDDVRESMKRKILDRVKLIVNLPQISPNQELELFDNLNGKRVSLDGADLIRAMIITRVARINVEDIDDANKHDVMLNENRVKNGLKLDEINNWWCNKEKQDFYRVFIKNINSKGENIAFVEDKYPIDILYKLYIQTSAAKNCLFVKDKDLYQKGSGTIKLQYFENIDSIADVFTQIQDVQRLVEYWYEDAELYHLIQYSAVYLKMTFFELTELWYSHNKTSFILALKLKIKENEYVKLALQDEDDNNNKLSEYDLNFKENWYDGDNTDMIPIMILLDIIRILRSKNSNFPIANLDPSHFCAVKEDKEHIFPQTPLETGYDIKTLKYYIDVAYKCGYNALDKKRVLKIVDTYGTVILAHDGFREWFNKKLTCEIVPINSLGNVCILQDKINRSYGNDFFAQKHFDIMQKSSNGEYIRPHVLDAFSKVMANPSQRKDFTYMQQWTKKDIFDRRSYIVSQINDYLS